MRMSRNTLASALMAAALLSGCSKPAPPPAPEPAPALAPPPMVEHGPKDDGRDYSKATVTLHVTHKGAALGDITVRFFPDKAPIHVRNFVQLSEEGAYNGTHFHRVIPGFMIQGGDPFSRDQPRSAHGMGSYIEQDGAERNLPAEFNDTKHVRGILSMARGGDPNSASCQFFICVAAYPSLDGQYTAFGEVSSGMDVADKIVAVPRDGNDNPLEDVVIESATVAWAP